MKDTTYKNASVVMTGIAGAVILFGFVSGFCMRGLDYREAFPFLCWKHAITSMAIPILFSWSGILIRRFFPSPALWVKILLIALIPAISLFWTFVHPVDNTLFRWSGERCLSVYVGIVSFLIPPKRLFRAAGEKGWLELALFAASAFLYVGVCRVVNHFGVESYQMMDGEWTRLFTRLMRFLPLMMSVWFLACFAFSKLGQNVGGFKPVGIAVQVLMCLYLLIYLYHMTTSYRISLLQLYGLFVQPVIIYLLILLLRIIRGGFRKSRFWQDIF